MYRVLVDNGLLWSPIVNDLKIINPTLDLELNTVGSFSFKLYPNHPRYNDLVKMKSIISIYQDNTLLFKGRIFSDSVDFRLCKKIECEGLMAYFNDSIVRPYSFKGSVVEYVDLLIESHNSQVPDYKQFKRGSVTVTDPNDTIVRASSDYPNTWEEISKGLLEELGGYLMIRYESDGMYLDYLSDLTTQASQSIQFAVNLLDFTNEIKSDTLATCIVPLGKAIEGSDTGEKVTIKSVNNGLDYIYDPEAEKSYGRITKVVTWDDVTEPANLLSKAKDYLKTASYFDGTVTIKALDLHLSDRDIEAFNIGQRVTVKSGPHGVNESMLINSYSLDISDPAGGSFTLGRSKASFIQVKNTADDSDVQKELDTINGQITVLNGDIDKKLDKIETLSNIDLENMLKED